MAWKRLGRWAALALVLGTLMPAPAEAGEETLDHARAHLHSLIPYARQPYRMPVLGLRHYLNLCPGPTPGMYPMNRHPAEASYRTVAPEHPYAYPSELHSYPRPQR